MYRLKNMNRANQIQKNISEINYKINYLEKNIYELKENIKDTYDDDNIFTRSGTSNYYFDRLRTFSNLLDEALKEKNNEELKLTNQNMKVYYIKYTNLTLEELESVFPDRVEEGDKIYCPPCISGHCKSRAERHFNSSSHIYKYHKYIQKMKGYDEQRKANKLIQLPIIRC
jgi:hypothetical protein